MDTARLQETIKRICQSGKGILAADESTGTIKKRLASINLESTEENRQGYRNTLFTTKGFGDFISGVILFDETVDQKSENGQTFSELIDSVGSTAGIKVDTGKDTHPDHDPQTLTHGLDALADRMKEYDQRSNNTLRFTKWRQVILVEPNPDDSFLAESMDAMAQYAKICQEAGYVPITEPEVLMDGSHSLEQCKDVTERTLKHLYQSLEAHGVLVEYTLLKPNMILSGKDTKTDSSAEVAAATLDVFHSSVPKEVPGIVFLSGGQTPVQATENLNAVCKASQAAGDPWWVSFSYGRALQEDALKAWAGKAENVSTAQEALFKRAKLNSLAQKGMYDASMEREVVAA